MNIYERAKAYLSMVVTHNLMTEDPNPDRVVEVGSRGPIRSSGKGANKMRAGVDRASDYGQDGNAQRGTYRTKAKH